MGALPDSKRTETDEREHETQAHLIDDPFPFRTRQQHGTRTAQDQRRQKRKSDQHCEP